MSKSTQTEDPECASDSGSEMKNSDRAYATAEEHVRAYAIWAEQACESGLGLSASQASWDEMT